MDVLSSKLSAWSWVWFWLAIVNCWELSCCCVDFLIKFSLVKLRSPLTLFPTERQQLLITAFWKLNFHGGNIYLIYMQGFLRKFMAARNPFHQVHRAYVVNDAGHRSCFFRINACFNKFSIFIIFDWFSQNICSAMLLLLFFPYK